MSSFVVGDLTVNRILGYMYFDRARTTVVSDLRKLGINTETDPARLGLKMIQLNCRATGERYREKVKALYSYRMETCSRIQAIKSLTCWLYQCAEGNIPERSRLRRIMERYRNDLAMAVVDETPEYNAAEWG